MINIDRLFGPKFSNLNALLFVGCVESLWAPLIPYVKQAFDLDESQLGLLLLCEGIGSLLVIPIAGWLCKRFGAKTLVYLFSVIIASAVVLISANVAVWLSAILLATFGMSMGVIDVSSNVNAVALEKRYQRPLMSGFHGGYSVGTLIGASSMALLLSLGLLPLPATILLAGLFLLYVMVGCRGLLTRDELLALSDPEPQQEGETKRRYSIPPMVIFVGLLCAIMYASEGAVMSWSSVYVNQELGVDISYSGYFYTAFAVMMSSLRLSGNALVLRCGAGRVVVGGAALMTAGFMVVAFVPNVYACIAGFAMVGLGAANIVPQLISYAGRIKGMPVPNIISLVNIIGYSGILVGPAIIGFVAKTFGFAATFAGIGALCAVVMISTYFMRIKN